MSFLKMTDCSRLPTSVVITNRPLMPSSMISVRNVCHILRSQEEKIDPVRSKFGKIEKEEVPLPDKLLYVETYARTHKKFSFRMLLEKQRSKMHIVVTFLAVLELMKTGMIRVYQEEICGEILIDSQI